MADEVNLSSITAYRLGRVEYQDGLAMQGLFSAARAQALSGDSLLLLEHPPVLTLGRGGKRAHIVAPSEVLSRQGVEVFETDRGGDVTYHGPGQIVGYPIFHLPPGRQDVRRYVREVEEAIIRALARFEIEGSREPRWPGVWVAGGGGPEKIAAIGVHLSRWYTRHGFALNVNTELSPFRLIVPCGIREAGVTSMQRLLGREVSLAEVQLALAEEFATVFGACLKLAPPPARSVSVAVTRQRKVLLLLRTRERGGFWQIVTGKVEEGESAEQAARRELEEETGQKLEVVELGYRHSFALAEKLPPVLYEESAFATRWEDERPVRLRPDEHLAYEWVDLEEALRRQPYPGLRRAVELAEAGPAQR